MQIASVRQVLDGDIACGSEVTIRGWVRTRRDSKAGFSFIHVNDGSGLNNLQLVAGRELPNYDNEIRRLTAGCAIVCRGKVVESRGRGQSVENKRKKMKWPAWLENRKTNPAKPKDNTLNFYPKWPHCRVRTIPFAPSS